MFIDTATIQIKAGDGGNGAVSFHREKYVAQGGPDGGDGGRGGNVVFQADDSRSTLSDFRYKRKFTAENGKSGGAAHCTGKSAPDLVLRVPRGTLIRDAKSGRLLADVSDDVPVVLAKGGRGGWGNVHFANATRQAPRFSKNGLPGECLEVRLELKLLADVGLVGFPNVGKSTLLSVVSQAKPKIANYHFTTLSPVLGVIQVGDASFVMADIPGLIEGAGKGAGLGHAFLRHIERCRMLIHVLDVSGSEGRDPLADYEAINHEMEAYNPALCAQPQFAAGNKCDLASEEQRVRVAQYFEQKGVPYFPLIAPIAQGTQALVEQVAAFLQKLPPVKRFEPDPIPDEPPQDRRRFVLRKTAEAFVVEQAPWLLRILEQTNPDDYASLQYFQNVLQTSGIVQALRDAGVRDGDTVQVEGVAFEYLE